LQGLQNTNNSNMAAAAQAPQAARDLLSRMQLAQSVQQQQQQQQQQQHQTNNNNAQNNKNATTLNFDPTKTAQASSNLASGTATADDLIQLQFEQDRHNRMIQMVQADRQERAMLANQEAMMKRQRRELKKGGSNDGGTPVSGGDNNGNNGTPIANNFGQQQVSMNDTVKNMFQFPNANAAASLLSNANHAANAGALTNVANAVPLGLGMNLNQGLNNTLNQGLNQGLQNGLNQGLQNGLNQGLQNGLNLSLQGGINQGLQNNLLGNLPLGALSDPSTEQHLHQKLGAATRGAAIVPCRARGMPVDHNFKTAYFVIPDGIEHGDELMCNYPACRQAGVKFRYCLHCKVPVAKRNFRNRHRHGVPGGDDVGESEESVSDEEETSTDEGRDAPADICLPCPKPTKGDGDDDYVGVKREHILIIPGVEQAASANALPLKKKKKKQGHIRVPCRARGMPMAHNFKTAYFIIPPNIEHGDELLCSFTSCKSAGAKFRYCLHCKVPVAKRNFRNRHKHGNMGMSDKGKKKELEALKTEEPSLKPATPKSEEDKKPSSSMAGSEDATKPSEVQVKEKEAASLSPSTVSSDMAVKPPAIAADSSSNQVSVSSSHNANEVQLWVQLLENKPASGDKQAMAVWMLNLMNASKGGAGGNGGGAAVAAAAAPSEAAAADAAPVGATMPFAAAAVSSAAGQAEGNPLVGAATVQAESEEMGTANTFSYANFKIKREQHQDQKDGDSTPSDSSPPPKKKFKQEFEAV